MAADAQLAARRADHHFPVGDQRRERHVVAALVISNRRGPGFLSGFRIERDEHGFASREVHLVVVDRDAAACRMQQHDRRRQRAAVPPQQRARLRIDGKHLIARRRHEHHAVDDDRRRFVAVLHAVENTHAGCRRLHVVGVDLAERAVAPAVIRAAKHRPVAIRRILQALGRDRLVLFQDLRHRQRLRSTHRRRGLLRTRRPPGGGRRNGDTARTPRTERRSPSASSRTTWEWRILPSCWNLGSGQTPRARNLFTSYCASTALVRIFGEGQQPGSSPVRGLNVSWSPPSSSSKWRMHPPDRRQLPDPARAPAPYRDVCPCSCFLR